MPRIKDRSNRPINDPRAIRQARTGGRRRNWLRPAMFLLVTSVIATGVRAGLHYARNSPGPATAKVDSPGVQAAAPAALPSESARPEPAPPDETAPATAVDAESAEELEASLPKEAVPEEPDTAAAPVEPFGPPDPVRQVQGSVGRGQSLFEALTSDGLDRANANMLVQQWGAYVDMRRVRPGDRYQFDLWSDGSLLDAVFFSSDVRLIRTHIDAGEARTYIDMVDIRKEVVLIEGQIETTLYAAATAAGERPELIMEFADVFAWDIDFKYVPRKGDKFAILVEKQYTGGTFRGYGRILAAWYDGSLARSEAHYFASTAHSIAGYFHPNGLNVQGAFLRAPLSFRYISSGYSMNRFHPVLGKNRPHRGIDYAAPTGTPVWAVADGRVIDAGRMGGAGLAVRLRHANGWITAYSHLSKIAVRQGEWVRQKQIIGNVGSTGFSTGPHLDYRLKIRNEFVNPLKVSYPSGPPIPQAAKPDFELAIGQSRQFADQSRQRKAQVALVPSGKP